MAEQFRVLILGYGEMGHAMEYLIKEQAKLDIWERHPKDNTHPVILEDAASQADIILFCLPVNPHREIAKKIAIYLKPNAVCLSIAKGLDETGSTAAQIFAEVFEIKQSSALLYGPMISEEILAGHPAFAQLACSDAVSARKIQR